MNKLNELKIKFESEKTKMCNLLVNSPSPMPCYIVDEINLFKKEICILELQILVAER